MKKNIIGAALIAALVMSTQFDAQSQSQPSAKATAKVGNINVINELSISTNQTSNVEGTWVTVLSNNLKTPNQKDAIIGVSMEVGLLTETTVRSKNGASDSSSSMAGVDVRVLIDDRMALPGVIVFGRRTQTLTATFQGIIDGCMTVDTNTWSVIIDPECVQPEELDLVLETMNANSFNFVAPNLTPGVHNIKVQARLNLGATAQAGSVRARALIGHGSVTAEAVRMIKNEDIEL